MKRGAPDHPKMSHLCDILKLKQYEAVGLLEMLWHYTATYTPNGAVGKYPSNTIAKKMGWSKDPELLMESLVESGWLDRSQAFRYVVHDWPEHADESVHMKLARAHEYFANGSLPRTSKLTKEERARIDLEYKNCAPLNGVNKTPEAPLPGVEKTEPAPPSGVNKKHTNCENVLLGQKLDSVESQDIDVATDDSYYYDERTESARQAHDERTVSATKAVAKPSLSQAKPEPNAACAQKARAPSAVSVSVPQVGPNFQKWWVLWCKLTGRRQHERQAEISWHSYVTVENEDSCFTCTARYGDSRDVERGAVLNPEKFLQEQSEGNFSGTWPKSSSAKASEYAPPHPSQIL